MNRVELFETELKMIADDDLRVFAEYCLNKLPEYFFIMPASTTGKYHPEYMLGDGGLVRHTKAAIKIASSLLSLEQYNYYDSDAIIFALLFHDGVKKGYNTSKYTVVLHPLLAADFIENALMNYLDKEVNLIYKIAKVTRLIRSHMGEFNVDYVTGEEVLPKPIEEDEKFVHMCDFLASRKFLNCEVN